MLPVIVLLHGMFIATPTRRCVTGFVLLDTLNCNVPVNESVQPSFPFLSWLVWAWTESDTTSNIAKSESK